MSAAAASSCRRLRHPYGCRKYVMVHIKTLIRLMYPAQNSASRSVRRLD